MSGQTSPPGRTFEERWPDDVAQANYLATPWVPIALGGLAGLFALPIVIAGWATALSIGTVLGLALVFTLLTLVTARTSGALQTWLLRLWRLVAWIGLATVVGLGSIVLTSVACDETSCSIGRQIGERPIPSVLVFALTVAGSVLAAVAVDRTSRRLTVR
jgi:hypothetical protein